MTERFSATVLLLISLGCAQSYETAEPIRTVPAPASQASFSGGSDWPQWRGPARDGISPETDLVEDWPATGPAEVWRRPLGTGYSGIAVAGGRVYTMAQDDAEYVVALDAASGEEIWRFRSDSSYRSAQGDGPRGTPTVDGERVYTVGARGMLHALNAETGEWLWSHSLPQQFGSSPPQWGYATSPLIEGNRVLVEPGGRNGKSLAAFETRSGRLIWSSYADPPGYSSPLAVRVNGVRQVLFFTAKHVVSVEPGRGRVLWDYPWETSYDVNAATPIFLPPDKVFVSSGYDKGAAVLQIRAQEDSMSVVPLWADRVMRNHFNSSVSYDGFLYGFDESTLKCVRVVDGEMQWRARGYGKGSLIVADGRLIVLSDRGVLALVEATPEAHRERARAQVLKGKCWTSPALANGKLYLRHQKEIVCLDLAASSEP